MMSVIPCSPVPMFPCSPFLLFHCSSVLLFKYLFGCLLAHWNIFSSFHTNICSSVCMFVCSSVLYVCLFICLYVCLFFCLIICSSSRLFMLAKRLTQASFNLVFKSLFFLRDDACQDNYSRATTIKLFAAATKTCTKLVRLSPSPTYTVV